LPNNRVQGTARGMPPLTRSVGDGRQTMHEEKLKQYFLGNDDITQLAEDLKGSATLVGQSMHHHIVDMEADFEVTPKHLVALCTDVLAGALDPYTLRQVAFCLIASDHFLWDTDTEEGNLVGETLLDWSAPEVNYPLTLENVAKFRVRLETGVDTLKKSPTTGST
jgi:hypothetical protein